MKTKQRKQFNYKYIWIGAMLILWELVARLNIVSPLAFPSLEIISNSFISSVLSGEILYQTLYSLKLISLGLAIGIVLAVVISSISLYNPLFESFVNTLISIFHPLPGIALLPLIILWIGIGTKAVVFIIVHSVLWPLIVNMTAGFRSIPQLYKMIGQNYEFSRIKSIFKIYMPASLPYALAGIKIGWARAWRAAISAEMIFGATGGIGGIGWYIFNKRVFMDTPGIFAGLIMIVVIGITVEDVLLKRVEKATVDKWGIQ